MAELDATDFRKTVESLHADMQAGKHADELLTRAMTLLDKCSATFDRMQASQADLAKSVRRMEGTLEYQGEKQDALLGAMKALLTASMKQIEALGGGNVATRAMGKSRRWLQAVPTPEPEPVATPTDADPDAIVKKGLILKAAQRLFGPRGGREIRYNPDAAARLMMEGKLTRAEQNAWKKYNRLPDHVQAS